MKLTITRAQLDQIERQARAALPNEACGLIVGSKTAAGDIIVSAVHASDNLAAGSESSFEIDPALHMRLQRSLRGKRDLRGSGEEIVGVYHSHPKGPAEPSARDVNDAGATAYPGWVWLITALSARDGAPVTRAYQHTGATFEPLEIRIQGV